MAGILFEDIFDVKDIDPDGMKFDRGVWHLIMIKSWKGWRESHTIHYHNVIVTTTVLVHLILLSVKYWMILSIKWSLAYFKGKDPDFYFVEIIYILVCCCFASLLCF